LLLDFSRRPDAPAFSFRTSTPGALGILIAGDDDSVRPFADQPLVVALTLDQLMHRRRNVLKDTLDKLQRYDCTAVLVRGAEPDQLKAGRIYQKLSALKDEGFADLLLLECTDALAAEWVCDNTPIHGIVIPFSRHHLAARYRLFTAAAAAGVGLIADTPDSETADPGFALAHPEISAAITPAGLAATVLTTPTPADLEAAWASYQQSHSPPPKLKGNHPPETA
jgi:hypothetical protein